MRVTMGAEWREAGEIAAEAGEEGTDTIRRDSCGEKEKKTLFKVTREESGWRSGRRGG